MARAITALVIALLMANPLCCCVASLAQESGGTSPVAHSCCQKAKEASEAEKSPATTDEPEDFSCNCAQTRRILTNAAPLKLAPPEIEGNVPSFVPAEEFGWSDRPLLSRSISAFGTGPPKLMGQLSLTILYGVFLR